MIVVLLLCITIALVKCHSVCLLKSNKHLILKNYISSREQQERADSPGPSCVSMKSDRSMGVNLLGLKMEMSP